VTKQNVVVTVMPASNAGAHNIAKKIVRSDVSASLNQSNRLHCQARHGFQEVRQQKAGSAFEAGEVVRQCVR
jgi:hypothetical protein